MNKRIFLTALVAVFATVLLACGLCGDDFDWNLPADIPPPRVPDDNPMTPAKVELGRHLFYDKNLSINRKTACASCHKQELAFSDERAKPQGTTGDTVPRNSMALINVAYSSRFTWANHLLDRLENQALVPLLGEEPVEMGLSSVLDERLDELAAMPHYQGLLAEAYPDGKGLLTLKEVTESIASFVRSLVSFDSAYDRYTRGDTTAMTESQLRGMQLFFSERLECFHCHGGFNFADAQTHAGQQLAAVAYHNNGLYNLDGEGAYPEGNRGIYELSQDPADMGRFKAPSVRNITVTAPYMHDGSLASLDEVIEHYARGGRRVESGPLAGDGSESPLKSEFVRGFVLDEQEKQDLLSFFEALTDESALQKSDWEDPFATTGGD